VEVEHIAEALEVLKVHGFDERALEEFGEAMVRWQESSGESPAEGAGPFVPLRGGASGPGGLLLAINPGSVAYISSYFDKKHEQNLLRFPLNNGRTIGVYEADAPDALEALGLGEFVDGWVLDLERDLG